jgi:uncharacterized protein (TIGR03067 family)
MNPPPWTFSRRSLTFLALGLALGALDAKIRADDPPTERKAILGAWTIVAGEEEGKPLPTRVFTGQVITFNDTTYVIKIDDRLVEKGTYALDPAKDPKAFDLKITESETDRDKSQLGIYKLQGDTLKMSFSRPGATTRPKRFETTPESATFTLELKRRRPEP